MSERVQNVETPTGVWVQPHMRERVGGREVIEDLVVVHIHSNLDTGYHYGIVAFDNAIYAVSQLVGAEWHLCGAVPLLANPRDLVRLAVAVLLTAQQQDLFDPSTILTWLQAHGQECSPIVVRRCLQELERQHTAA